MASQNIGTMARKDAKQTTVGDNRDSYDKLQISNLDSGRIFETSTRDDVAVVSKTQKKSEPSTPRTESKGNIPPSKVISPPLALSPSVDDFRRKHELLKEFHTNRKILWCSKLICLLPLVLLNVGIALAGFIQDHDFAFYF